MFVHLGGDENSKPTYFEVIAADRLVPSLKAAVIYALSVFSQRHPWVYRLLNYDDEVFALLTLVLDGHSLLSSDSTFSDSLYGLKLQPLRPGQNGRERLTRRQRWLVLACKVLLPYLKSKADKVIRRSASASGGILALALRYGGEQGSSTAAATAASSGPPGRRAHGGEAEGEAEGEGEGASGDLRERLVRAFVAAYPWLHAALEGTTFAYHLSYLLGASSVHHPVLHALGVSVARTSAKDLMDADKAKQASRQALLQALRASRAAAATAATAASGSRTMRGAAAAARHAVTTGRYGLVRGLLAARWLLEDHARSSLILAVFGFKALEWWYSTAEGSLARSKVLPPPPPPPPPRPVPPPGGVGLPADPSDCPLCRKRTTNPATIATSGYVFCYPCAFNHVMQHGCCPVSLLPAGLDHVRKLYEAA
ncbi:hypothetical protein VOLCADRAFT_127336 [Volvox carteri f. nagariensis]|uniref:Pex N-terminal domain-containing protein n=1 Tax=Volvox carteri f. nagariensis TaxID=3068 RepID=D8THW8_VOLCA|nr:uncharacterized protein VOLCADRAFT_127336 [Volvox carteri f. nagariensis]EFJ53139.1 hypothetical protein VOLCADRAFT_127336 [Volvox carteri f. nagariensis]|eukprot:XP_002946144.1 hypothetical protein VOLCADRAFT_127336 [Volvox carteri f. nagariensis]